MLFCFSCKNADCCQYLCTIFVLFKFESKYLVLYIYINKINMEKLVFFFSKGLFFLPSRQVLRNSAFSPPWIMAKRFCLSGFLLAAMQRSSQRIDLCIASSTRGPVTVLLTTSSSCIMMSDPGRTQRNMEMLSFSL